MACEPRMFLLVDYAAVRYVFGTFLLIISFTASASNILVLAIIKLPGNFTKSNKILTSLAISDLLVGLLLAPLSAWQVLSTTSLANCRLDDVRVFFTLFLTGSSVMTLAIVALDRYLVLTKISKRYITNRKIIVLLSIAWLLPILGASIRFVGRYPYLAMVIFILIGPLIILIITYILITIAVSQQEKKLREHQTSTTPNTPKIRGSDKTDGIRKKQEDKSVRKKRSDIRLAKVVTVLILCYLICVVPLSIWAMVGMINIDNDFVSPKTWQFLYIISIFLALSNSCLNPAIYFLKTPTFRKGLKRLWRKKNEYSDNSSESAFKVYSSKMEKL